MANLLKGIKYLTDEKTVEASQKLGESLGGLQDKCKNLADAVGQMSSSMQQGTAGVNEITAAAGEGLSGIQNLAQTLGNISFEIPGLGETGNGILNMGLSVSQAIPGLNAFIFAVAVLAGLFSDGSLSQALAAMFPPEVQYIIAGIAGAIIAALVPAMIALVPTLLGMAAAAWAAIAPLIPLMAAGAALAALALLIYNNWEAITEFFSTAWQTVCTSVTEVWNGLVAFFTGVWTNLTNFLAGVWEGIKTTAVNAWTTIANFFREWWGTILLGILTGGIGLIILTIVHNWDRIKELTQEAWESIKTTIADWIQNAYDTVVGIITGLPGWLAQTWNNIVTAAGAAWQNFKQTVTTLVTDAANGIINGLDKAWDWIRNIPSQAISWGKNIMTSLVQGIASVKIPLPTFKLTWKKGPMGIDIPSLDVGVNLKSIGSILGSLSSIIPGLAIGGIVLSSGLALVGERGPELLSLPRGAQVTPLNRPVTSTTEVHLHVGTLVADDLGLKQLERKLREFRINENARLGVATV